MTCAGPSKELLRVATLHAGCTVECFIHVGIIKTIAIVVVFVFMNMSRVILFSGFIKLNWRSGSRATAVAGCSIESSTGFSCVLRTGSQEFNKKSSLLFSSVLLHFTPSVRNCVT